MSTGLKWGIIGFCVFAYPGLYFAIDGNLPVARALIYISMIPGYVGIGLEISTTIDKWISQRNKPRVLG